MNILLDIANGDQRIAAYPDLCQVVAEEVASMFVGEIAGELEDDISETKQFIANHYEQENDEQE